ncbi:MAG: tetratricopeptide repeat protein [Pyrinomonadaceae bacterium]|nr:tetratricopeptide repeat protein [Pyrinomonadaceae bacterium]
MNKLIRKTWFAALILMVGFFSISGQTPRKNIDRVMVMPFENTSNKAEFNWVGESIADSLTSLLNVPSLNVITNEERKLVQRRLNMPLTVLPSLATSIKLAREGKATLLVAGSYQILPETQNVAASITIKARVIRVNEGTFLAETLPNGRLEIREINLRDALGNLQTIQGQLAYQILLQHDNKSLSVSRNELIDSANKVPSKAFEAYIKGLLTPSSDQDTRANYFKNAMLIYEEERKGKLFADAALELGHLYLSKNQNQNAIAYFSRIPNDNPHYAEAAFYTGLIQWRQKRYDQALAVLRPLADDLKLISVYNTLGAIAIQASLSQKKDAVKAEALLVEGIGYLEKAAESTDKEPNVFFNQGFALFLRKEYKQAAEKLRPVLAGNPRDGEAYFLLAKTLRKLGDEASADFDNQARRFLTENNRYASLENSWNKEEFDGIKVRLSQPTRREFVSVVLTKNRNDAAISTPVSETAALIKKAQAEFEAGRNESSMTILRRLLVSEPMNAEIYLLLGKIHLRRGDLDQATDSLKTAYFWNSRLVEAHILLGRIFIQKKDCLQAQNYSRSALEIVPESEDALALERQVERCSK